MELIQKFFNDIERDDISEKDQDLISSGLIDSIDIIALVKEIEKYYQSPLNAKYIKEENFKNFKTIKNMLDQCFTNPSNGGGGIAKMQLFKTHNGIYTTHDLINTLKNLNIQKGDTLYVHSQIYDFGIPLLTHEDLLKAILDCFFELIGEEGTLIMPTFTYSFCDNKIYDILNSKSKMGALNEFFRTKYNSKRTNDPLFSFAIKGAKENLFLQETNSCFGINSVYDVLTKEGGKIVLFGDHRLGITYIHYIEEQAKISYRFFKDFKGTIIDNKGKSFEKTIAYFCRSYDKKSITSLDLIINFLKQHENIEISPFANAEIATINVQNFFNTALKALQKDEQIFLIK